MMLRCVMPDCVNEAGFYDPLTLSQRCEECADEVLDKPLVPEVRGTIAGHYPHYIMDDAGDSVPDVRSMDQGSCFGQCGESDTAQVRADNPQVGQECGGGEGDVKEKACKWHRVRLDHPVAKPDFLQRGPHPDCRPGMSFGVTHDIIAQKNDIHKAMVKEHCDAVWSYVRSNMREMPTCQGRHLELKIDAEEGTAEWFCREHCNEEV